MKIPVGVIGLGIFFNKAHLPVLKKMEGEFEVRGVYTSSSVKFESFREQFSTARWYSEIDALVASEEIQAVIACLPIPQYAPVAKKVFEGGKHLLIEKPMAHSLRGAEEMICDAKRFNCRLQVAENFRYLKTVERLREIVDGEAFGKLQMVSISAIHGFHPGNPYYETSWRTDPQGYPGILWDGLIHYVSMIRYVFGDFTPRYQRSFSINPEIGRYDSIQAQLALRSGVEISLHASYSLNKGRTDFMDVYFDEATVRCGMYDMTIETNSGIEKLEFPRTDYQNIYADLHCYITEGNLPRYTALEALGDVAALERLLNL